MYYKFIIDSYRHYSFHFSFFSHLSYSNVCYVHMLVFLSL